MYLINCDASIQPFNPGGIVAWGFIVKQNRKIIHQDCAISVKGGPLATNNVGEYHAVIAALLWLIKQENQRIPAIVMSDSDLVIRQLNKSYGCHEEHLVKLNNIAQKAVDRYKSRITFKWVPREKNIEADALSRSAYDEDELEYYRNNKLDLIFEGDDIPF